MVEDTEFQVAHTGRKLFQYVIQRYFLKFPEQGGVTASKGLSNSVNF